MKDTHDAEFVRDYSVSVERLWRAVTDPDDLMRWFGPEGVTLDRCDLNLGRLGPWSCVMIGLESGNRFKVTGVVTHVRPPADGAAGSVGFTWAWHDDADRRGAESHVTFAVTATATGARLTLSHRALPDLEAAQSHSRGWLSTLTKLDALMASAKPHPAEQGD